MRTRKLTRLGLLAACALAWTTIVFTAPNPANGTISEANKIINYTGGVVAGVNTGSQCADSSAEKFILTTDLPSDFGTKLYSFEIDLAPEPGADLILTLRDASGNHIASSDGGSHNGAESLTAPGKTGTTQYHVIVCAFDGSTPSYSVHIELSIAQGGGGNITPTACDATAFGTAEPTCPGVPRYQLFAPPAAASYAHSGNGEYNIGFNPKTRRIMAENNVPVARVTPAEIKPDGTGADSGMPEACPELWENKSSATPTTLDPILWTDQVSGRTFSSNQTSGANGGYAYSDDDGDNWIDIGLAIPAGGVDHQTIGSGPFPANIPLGNPQNKGQYALYCTQNLVGSVCQRSLTLGTSWENGQVATGPGAQNSQGCGGLHGHARVAPDGSAWLPDKSCGSKQGGAISIDTSTTPWTEFSVAGTDDRTGQPFVSSLQATGNSDPSIAFDSDNIVYYCYGNGEPGGNEGHPHVAVGRRTPGTTNITWLRDTDVGATHGIKNAAFTQAWAGSPGRASCGFLGTNVAGSYQGAGFPGDWYLFIATTYDQGRTWVTVNATPNDPVQHAACIWNSGGSNQCRNLLDFNEVTADDKGRVLFGYSDGCITPGCVARTAANDFVADMRVARQIGGKTLFAAQDASTDTNDGVVVAGPVNPRPVPPKRPCLLDNAKKHPSPSSRDATAAHLFWRAPDNGGVPIVNYDIFRSTAPADPSPTKIATTPDAKPQYDDTTVEGSVPFYYYTVKANTASQSSAASNEVGLQIGSGSGSPCQLPGLLTVYDLIDNPDGSVSDDDSGQNTPPTGSINVKWLSMAEPYLGAGANKLVFTLQVEPDAAASPSSEWYIIWNRKTVAADGSDRAYVAMLTDAAGTPRFEYGNFGPPIPIGGVPPPNGNTPTPLGLADSGTYNVATGVIAITLSNSLAENVAAGQSLAGLNIRTIAGRYSGDPSAPRGQKSQNNSSDITGTGSYTLVGNLSCRPNTPPVIDFFESEPERGMSPLTVALSATAHDDDTAAPADSIATWHIDFGDGQSVDLSSPPAEYEHVYTSDLQHAFLKPALKVTDSRGKDSLVTRLAEVEIDNTPLPQLVATPAAIVKGSTVTLDASGSSTANNASVDESTFDAGDGTAPTTVSASSIQHTYDRGGSYVASVNITDSQGFASDQPGTATVEVSNTAPVASLIADRAGGETPVTVTFDASGSYDPDEVQTSDRVMSYRFDFGDGAVETKVAPAAVHSFSAPGVHTVLLRVFDEEGMPSGADALVQVEVLTPPPAPDNNHVAGALAPAGLALLGLGALLRGRRRTARLQDRRLP
jgi:hypothetical protein